MPKREEKKTGGKQYSYEDLLSNMRTYLNENYGGVAKFLESEKFLEIGFQDTKAERSKLHIYLANQTDKTKTVKSFPVLQKLYKGLLEIELTSRVEVVRTQIIISEKSIK